MVLHLVAVSHCSSLKEFDSSLSIISVVIIIIIVVGPPYGDDDMLRTMLTPIDVLSDEVTNCPRYHWVSLSVTSASFRWLIDWLDSINLQRKKILISFLVTTFCAFASSVDSLTSQFKIFWQQYRLVFPHINSREPPPPFFSPCTVVQISQV